MSIVCKTLGHVIHSSISHFERNNILTDCQHGFRKRRSYETQLILTIEDLARGLNDKQQIDAVLLDFSKAFDRVPHQGLLLKLKHYGVRGNILSWIEDFLSARTQEIIIKGSKSSPSPVMSGVPQGTVLGPFLFLAYINDMPECVKSKIKLFADDSLLYRRIKNIADCHQLQEDLNKLQEWEQRWQTGFNADKCEVIRITNKKRPLCSDYTIHNQKLNIETEAKYLGLGVTISSDLSWSRHADKKANSTMGFLKRNIRSAPQATKDTAYKTFVRPIVEYAAPTWAPSTDTNTDKIEMVQGRAARFVTNDYVGKSSVTEMIADLGWDTLQKRRDLARLSMMYRILHNLADIPVEPYLTLLTSMTKGHDFCFHQIRTTNNTYQQSSPQELSSCGTNSLRLQ